MDENPYEAPHEPNGQTSDKSKPNPRLLLAWDAFNVVLWMIVLATLAALLMPAVL
jgi:hypothetical protein